MEITQADRSVIWKALCQPSLKVQESFSSLQSGSFDAIIDKNHGSNPLLARILKAYSAYDPEVGYQSSLASVVTPLLAIGMPENQVFSMFVRLMETYDMRQLYLDGLPLLLQQFKSLFTCTCAHLESHFSKLSIQPSMYASQWFLTLFNMPHAVRLYDLVWLQGAVQTMLRTSIWILQTHQAHLLSLTQTGDILDFLSNVQFKDIQWYDVLAINISQINAENKLQDLLSRLEKENATLTRENMNLRMQELDQDAAQLKLLKRTAALEKKVKKYKIKLANSVAEVKTNPYVGVPKTRREDQFNHFVASLRDSGDFGALIAGALVPVVHQEEPVSSEQVTDQQEKLDAALQNVTSELVAVKLDHFNTCQQYESLMAHCQALTSQVNSMQEAQTALCQKVVYLESELEDVVTERDQIYADQEQVLSMAMVSKKTCAELQLEKLNLAKQVERLEFSLVDLQQEKQAFFMPRGTFSEEVFAAHTILFGQQKADRRHQEQEDEYKTKYVESELRCRELEKYLAESKVRLAEFECSSTPRGSLQQPRRTASNKRSSTASLSMLANRTTTPTLSRERRESTESYASSTTSLTSLNSSNYNSKRSSMYSRIWNAFGSPPATPTTMVKNSIIMCEEPQII
ncbi:rab-GTPase-TBC domain-containing protein [Mucor mucedo]|uniref:rab-GTPase-TBC domain-containing protein n=1 Tax=Mucor mucedo TaxID=29922 RepID=UPI00221FCEA8|nr:rab-GTPase-TBC domain-containing protein [Mucor mucedo]KAI7894608.1 rab-GTPase-TBC domain-containing protein [Mucor mucedo]